MWGDGDGVRSVRASDVIPRSAARSTRKPGHEVLPKTVKSTPAKLERLVKLGILTEADTGTFARQQ
ncbi:hypothetical protein CA983_31030 [Streptomyces swartbergensis]|uniref:Uncharacterized protein n=1 Tax=Streptomyces swartbergensis TaxID=487165 RepID=A0A243RPS7_9ACTN|nr:hypothetical protein CA983_31030 [Streptomyces swartbergensis]